MEENGNSSTPGTAIEVQRISLRLFEPSDIDDFMAWASNEDVSRFCSWEPGFGREVGLDLLSRRMFFSRWIRSICLDGKSIGEISVTGTGGDGRRAEIGYVVGSDYWGKGIATYAVRLAATAIFWEWPQLERLEGLVDVENVGSQRVLQKVGFMKEGVLRKYYFLKGQTRDMVMYSLLPADLS